jgi:hypothetical protein
MPRPLRRLGFSVLDQTLVGESSLKRTDAVFTGARSVEDSTRRSKLSDVGICRWDLEPIYGGVTAVTKPTPRQSGCDVRPPTRLGLRGRLIAPSVATTANW